MVKYREDVETVTSARPAAPPRSERADRPGAVGGSRWSVSARPCGGPAWPHTPTGCAPWPRRSTRLPALTRSGVYWAGRLTCCSRADDIPVYDRVFEVWFVTGPGDERSRTRVEVDRPVGEVDDDAAGEESGDDDPGLVTADREHA